MAQYEVTFSDSRSDFQPVMVEADGFEVYTDSQPLVALFHNNVPNQLDPTAQNLYGLNGLGGGMVRRQVAAYSGVLSVREVIV